MNKKVGKTLVSNEVAKGLKGFEDVFEDYVQSEEYKENERRDRENSKVGEQYELLHFLEQENLRLSSLETFFTKKIPLKINFSQTSKLTLIQIDRKKFLKEKLINHLRNLDSELQRNLSSLMNSHFS
jgi:hypothetical protein